MKIVLGISGRNGSGKDTVADYLVSKHQAEKLVFSDLLTEALSFFITKIGRSDHAWLSTFLREKYGEGILGVAMKRRIKRSTADLVVVSGLRDFGELSMIRSFSSGYLVFVETDQKVRWERLKKRNKKADDTVSFLKFQRQKEKLPSEAWISGLKEKADFIINNNSQRELAEQQVEKILTKIYSRANNN
jgi:uridine kinase